MANRAHPVAARLTPAVRGALRLALVLGLALLGAACNDLERGNPVGTAEQAPDPVPSGAHLYCITNVGHTLVAYDLATRAVRTSTARYLDLDPVGPWFHDGAGYYLSRVETSGAGSNSLIRFDPVTTAETGRLRFAQNSNPNSLLLLPAPHEGRAWVALRGSTFDGFTTDGVAVVKLDTLTTTALCDLNADTETCARLVPAGSGTLTSPLGFLWDASGCGGGGCAYAVVNNFDGLVHDGLLLVLEPDTSGRPVLRESVALGRNPQLNLVLEASGELWVVNNGGFVHFSAEGRPGTLQVLNTADWQADPDGDGLPGRTLAVESAATCTSPLPNPDPGCDLTGIYAVDDSTAWVTTYPHDVLRAVDLASNALLPLDSALPSVTGPFFPVSLDPLAADGRALFAALGGLGLARLGELDSTTAALRSDQRLQAGSAPLDCAEYQVP